MGIINDYLHSVKRPIIAIIALFFIQSLLILLLQLFTDLANDQLVYAWVVGGINFAFLICWLLVLCWAGIRSIRMTKGVPLDGAIGGAMAAAIAGLFIGIITFLFNISMPTVFGEAAMHPTGAAAAAIMGFVKVFVGVIGIIIGLVINLIVGAIFGALGSLVEEERILSGLPESCLKAQKEKDKALQKKLAVACELNLKEKKKK
jgi:hypothetical protein